MLTLTDSAVKHLQDLLRENGTPGQALRIYVERGGCAGMSYEMKLDVPHSCPFVSIRGFQAACSGAMAADYCALAVISGPGSNEVPQPQERTARGLLIRKPAPARSSL